MMHCKSNAVVKEINMNRIKAILEELKKGNFSISIDDKIAINDAALNIMTYADEEFEKRKDLLDELVDIITIGNITYEHCDTDYLIRRIKISNLFLIKILRKW